MIHSVIRSMRRPSVGPGRSLLCLLVGLAAVVLPARLAEGRGRPVRVHSYGQSRIPIPPSIDRSGSITARRNVGEARTELSRAESEIGRAVVRLNQVFQQSTEWQATSERLRQAEAELDGARARVLARVRERTDYATLRLEKERLNAHLDVDRDGGPSAGHAVPARGGGGGDVASPGADGTHLSTEAGEKMAVGDRLSRIEAEGFAAEPVVARAKAALLEASAETSRLRARFEASIRNDPGWVAARSAADQARVKLRAAEQELTLALEREARLEADRQRQIREINQRNANTGLWRPFHFRR